MARLLQCFLLFCLFLTVSLPCFAAEEEIPEQGPGLYFGLLHSHSSISDGTLSAQDCFLQAAAMEGLDFFALTDHSDSLDNPASLSEVPDSELWAAGKAAAQAATNGDFLGIYGFEMSWGNGLGHIGTFGTPGFVSWRQGEFSDFRTGLQNFYAALSGVEGAIGQFHHPSLLYGYFQDFAFLSPEADRAMALLEVGSPDLPTDYYGYDLALELGWHVAPTNNHPSCRTVIYAQALTEEAIYAAIRSRRVYATEDPDLSIHYSMNGNPMGSRLKRWQIGDSAEILLTLSDPTDPIGTVEVIGEKGISLGKQTSDSQWFTGEFSLPADQRYYYIKVTQPDGDTAVTAPIWVEQAEYTGIENLVVTTPLPVAGQPVELALTLYNQEAAMLTVEKIEIFLDGYLQEILTETTQLWQGSTTIPLSLTPDRPGRQNITVTVTADLGGTTRQYTACLTVTSRLPEGIASILVDGTHGDAESYAQLAALAVENNIVIHRETGGITPEMLANSSILLLPGPKTPYSEEFISMVRDFVDYGGKLLLTNGNSETNRLLQALGSNLRFGEGTEEVRDLADFQPTSPWCANLLEGQRYCCSGTLLAQEAQWIVKNALAADGRIFAGCGNWLSDSALALPGHLWKLPYANRTILQNILGSSEAVLPLTDIAALRTAPEGQLHRIQGYVTASSFADTLYVQDNTGGIAVVDFGDQKPTVGTAVEIHGILAREGKNPVLKQISCSFPDVSPYRYLPETGVFSQLLNPEYHSGDLVQVEGKVVSFRKDESGAIRELVLEQDGQFAAVFLDEGIVSHSLGYNDLAQRVETGRIFRAIGLVYMRSDGVSVVRVRNCDEVVHVPVIRYYWEPCQPDNPRVGDGIGFWIFALFLSAAFLRKSGLCKPHCKP